MKTAVPDSSSKCSSGCPTPGLHRSYGECLRSKNVAPMAIAPDHDHKSMNQWDKDLTAYKDARDAGLQPTATTAASAEMAYRTTDAMHGVAFDGSNGQHQLAQKLVAADNA